MQYQNLFVSLRQDGQDDKGAAPPLHGCYKEQGNTPRDTCAQVSLCPWLPLSPQPSPTPRPSRHRTAQIPHCHLCQRLLLAWTRRLRQLQDAQDQHRLLGKQNPTQQTTRHRRTTPDSLNGLALHHHLGMSAQAPLPPANSRLPRPNPLPHLPRRPHRPPLPSARFRRHPHGGRACTRKIISPSDVIHIPPRVGSYLV